MTAYFDAIDNRLAYARPGSVHNPYQIDYELVFDVSVRIALDDFPADLRERANRVMLHRAVQARPVNAGANERVESFDDVVEELREMSAELHTIFHEFCIRDPERNSDEPRSPLLALYAKSEAAREAMWAADHPETP